MHYLLYLLGFRTHKFAVGDKVIFTNIFGVVYLWTISEITIYERYDGTIVPAYHHEGTQTPWFPTQEKDLHWATKADQRLSQEQLQQKYGFTPIEWYGCY